MALVIADRVLETSTSTGTGAFTLDGAVTGYQSFASGVGDGNSTYYTIVYEPDQWEVGIGTYNDTTGELSRDTIIASSNSNAAVNFVAGIKQVFVTYPGGKAVYEDASGNVSVVGGTISALAAATQDAVKLQGRSGGTSSYGVTLTPATLSANRTVTLPDANTTVVGTDVAQTLTNKTLGDTIVETVFALTDASTVDIDPGNGSIQTLTLTSTGRTLTFTNMVAGEAVTLMINDGSNGTITTWNATFVNNGGIAPTLSTTAFTVVVLWKVSTTVYAAVVGNA